MENETIVEENTAHPTISGFANCPARNAIHEA